LQGGAQNANNDLTVVANKLHQDDRDILIAQFAQKRDSHDTRRDHREGRLAGTRDKKGANQNNMGNRSSISPYKYKDPRLSAEKPLPGPRNSTAKYYARFSGTNDRGNENDVSQSNFANVTQNPGGLPDAIPKTQNIEIRMKNRLHRHN